MQLTLGFDVYGTLIDTHGVVDQLRSLVGDNAEAFSQTWRDKQLEYSFRRGLMQRYAPFSVCTSDALDYCCLHYNEALSAQQKTDLLESYSRLPIFADVKQSLQDLVDTGHNLFAFSNGTAEAVDELLINADIRDYFQAVISVDAVQSFKPNPAVYRHFIEATNADPERAWLISSNPFDVIGAVLARVKAAWLQRDQSTVFDPWGVEPTLQISDLIELDSSLAHHYQI